MSKDDSANLRLLGSPVNLSYRNKRNNYENKRNICNRPRSALQNSCFTPDLQEVNKRPFSAGSKEHLPSTRTFLNTFNAELIQSYNNTPNTIRVVLPPTAELLADRNSVQHKNENRDCNASDHGSEDTFVSLGTKIKARAQSPKGKSSNCKNFIKYRNIAKKGKKAMENAEKANGSNDYNLDVKITEKRHTSPPTRNKNLFDDTVPSQRLQVAYDCYFNSLEKERQANNEKRANDNNLSGRVSFGSGALHSEVEQALDTYSRRLGLPGQQLSLVEEESTQDIESVPSRNSLSLEPSHMDIRKQKEENHGDSSGTYVIEQQDGNPSASNQTQGPRTYDSFYDDFQTTVPAYNKMSSMIVGTDSSSKDSGYTDSGGPDERPYRRGYTCPNKASLFMPTNNTPSRSLPKSLECIPQSSRQDSNDNVKTFPPGKKPLNWAEPCHSRLLFKDFFLKKDTPPSPKNMTSQSDAGCMPGTTREATEMQDDKVDYPQYLLNSNTKAYTTKVIEDYKKEIEAINNLHELTLRDIKTDPISPTPFNIDKMFEQDSGVLDISRPEVGESSQACRRSSPFQDEPMVKEINLRSNKKDISKVSTKELIQNYFKVKESDFKDSGKDLKKYNKKINNLITTVESGGDFKQVLNNKGVPKICTSKGPDTLQIKNQTQRSAFTLKTPLSSRIESIQNDKDIESWMSLSAPSPRILEIEDISGTPRDQEEGAVSRDQGEPSHSSPHETRNTQKSPHETSRSGSYNGHNENQNTLPATSATSGPEASRPKELSADATVFDIYSMLKEIEHLGETAPPPPSEPPNETARTHETHEDTTPKDNFMEIFQFLEKVEQSANDALSVVTNTAPQSIPSLEVLLKLPQTELAQRLVTASLQLEERSCCIALLQESLTSHKEQMVNKVSNLEKQSMRSIGRVKSECEEAIRRHQTFIDQLINDKKTLNHRIEQLVDERRALEERWRRAAQALEERYKLELRNQHDKMAAAQQVARQRWVRQKAEKIKELTVKGLEGELREMADRQQKEIADLRMTHAEQLGRAQAQHSAQLEQLRASCEREREEALVKERQMASARLEKQILELEATYQEQRKRLVAEMRAENERVATGLSEKEKTQRLEIEKWKEEQEQQLRDKMAQVDQEIAKARADLEEEAQAKRRKLEEEFEEYKQTFEAEQQAVLKRRVAEISQQHKLERDKEIEKAIESMEAEAQAGRKDLQEALRRNKEQYEAELKELAETEQATSRRYQEAQARVRQTEDRCAELEVEVNQLQTRNKVLTEKTVQLEQQVSTTRDSCEASWAARVDHMKKELEDAKRTHEEQMHQLYAKVKIAVARKDSAIQAMTRETAKCQEKITLLEQKLQLQRKDYLKHK